METKNDITELRDILFDTLRQLKNKDAPLDIERAKAINETAQVIINTAKIEVDYAKVTGGDGSQSRFLTGEHNPDTKPSGGYVHKIGQRHGIEENK